MVVDEVPVDGIPEQEAFTSYDAEGRITQVSAVWSGTETLDSWTYDAAGNLLERERLEGGALDYRQTYTYDAAGNALSYLSDDQHDGLHLQLYTYEDGLLSTTTNDDLADGVIDTIERFTYDTGGLLTEHVDDRLVGAPEWVGTVTTVYTYDLQNRLETVAQTNDTTATADERVTRSYVDAFGSYVELFDTHIDGVTDRIYTITFDSDGQPVHETTDEGADGSIDRQTTSAYHPDGHGLIEQSVNSPYGGASYVWAYDSEGREVFHSTAVVAYFIPVLIEVGTEWRCP